MTPYSNIFKRFLGRIDTYSLSSLSKNDFYELATEWLNASVADVDIRQLFTTLILDDEVQELSFELKNSIDEKSDERFVIEIVALGMEIAWLTSKVDSELYTTPVIAGKEERKLIDGHSELCKRLASLELQLHKIIDKHNSLSGTAGGA